MENRDAEMLNGRSNAQKMDQILHMTQEVMVAQESRSFDAHRSKGPGGKGLPHANTPSSPKSALAMAEKLKYNIPMLVTKGVVCWALFAFVWYGVAKTVEDDSFEVKCNKSASLCEYTTMGFVISVLLLLPSLIEMGHSNLILSGVTKQSTRALLENLSHQSPLEYIGKGLLMAVVSLVSYFVLILLLVVVPIQFFRGNPNPEARKGVLNLVQFFAICADTALTWSLFPLSGFVIFSANGFADVITNLVAVQVFAKLDDEIVQMLFSPDAGVQSIFSLYTLNGASGKLQRIGESDNIQSQPTKPNSAVASSDHTSA